MYAPTVYTLLTPEQKRARRATQRADEARDDAVRGHRKPRYTLTSRGTPRLTQMTNSSTLPSLHMRHLGVRHCPCVFVDIGLNNGHTLLHWWRDAALRRLPRAPAARLLECTSLPSEQHCYYGIEANPRWDATLRRKQQNWHQRGLRVHLFTRTALSTAVGAADFFYEKSAQSPGLDASLEPSRQEHYKDHRGWQHNRSNSLRDSSAFTSVQVRTMDAAPFFAGLVRGSGFVAVKLDIEGHEYDVLRHILFSEPAALCRLDVLAVEWHEALMVAGTFHFNASEAFQWLLAPRRGCNVSLLPWH